ncbi:hypothetical protein Kpol_543p64 [Vanderwaltozyma polyspora DSM 70294]|uniref:Zinc-regulated transporter 2 n=1 Tax=Vanderwaltozyma polyspora (strain ATCC 22028 / DSM 70294 / BCRC 21397 / CBS 2163 / NBRC 10782 / NRRL Y-8283 / UCD 57-17) TaxID=436907 RepID=A7THR8_VANPO|nr:uncharacterized protein Kpol_543p64 [Vanderwaltozyma polyspora DSM 70294]EDO18234.1 hypothetical protein Kpol_543p64 [Vanderwaltozyma polyspora DSM 70294]
MDVLRLLVRDTEGVVDTCEATNDFDGRINLRVLSIFMIMISSGLGVFFPLLASRYSFIRLPEWCFFIAKFFGSGVIVSTAFIHLLVPAAEALGNDCLGGTFVEYPWAFGICLMSLFLLFFTEIITHYFMSKSLDNDHGDSGHSHSHFGNQNKDIEINSHFSSDEDEVDNKDISEERTYQMKYDFELDTKKVNEQTSPLYSVSSYAQVGTSSSKNSILPKETNIKLKQLESIPGKNHYSHDKNHQDPSQLGTPVEEIDKEQYLGQIVGVTILEIGVIFHSIFVGLSLAVSGEEFITLFIVLVFHQMFEGLGLGTRLAEANWPHSKRYTPWLMALGFTLTTPIAIAIGIGVRYSWIPGSRKSLIANGVFDAISSGILIYTGLVELMAHEFLFSNQFKGPGGFKRMLSAYFVMCCGAALMAVLGRWA